MYSFENLEVWKKSKSLVKVIYEITNEFPNDEKFGITSQIRRAAISVSSNIAEGSTRWSKKEKARFYEVSYGSLIELLNQLIISEELGFLENPVLTEIKQQIDEISRMLSGLYKNMQSATKALNPKL